MNECLDVVDQETYPIADLESAPAQALVESCREALDVESFVNLPGFIKSDALDGLVEEARATQVHAYRKNSVRNAYFTEEDPTLSVDDPRRQYFRISMSQVAGDLIPNDSGVAVLYAEHRLVEFIRRVLHLPALYCRADIFQNLNYIFLDDGDVQPWHFDQNQFSVTLLLQAPRAGGTFELVPDLRRPDDECLADVKRVMRREHPGVRRVERSPGALTLFRGDHSMHRVTEVAGDVPRISAIFSYDTEPGLWASRHENEMIYGARVRDVMAQKNVDIAARGPNE